MSNQIADGVSSDELERLRAQLALCETRLTELQQLAQFGYWERDFSVDRPWWSGELRRILGLPPDAPAVTVAEGLDFIHPDDRQLAERMYRKIVDAGESIEFEHRILWPDGTERIISSRAKGVVGPSGAVDRVLGVIQDITECRKSETALREKERFLSESQRIAHIGGWRWDLSGPIRWTDETYRVFGVSRETFTPTLEAFIDLIHSEDQLAMRQWLKACAAGEKPETLEFRVRAPDGSVRVLSGCGEMIYDAANRPVGMAGTVQDVTEQKNLTRALFESEARCRSVFEHLPLGVAVLDRGGRYLITNAAWSRMTGYSPEELAQMNALDLTHPEDSAATLQVRAGSNAGTLEEYAVNKRYVRKNGEVFWARTVGATLADERGAVSGRVAIIEDISAQRQTELRRAQRRRVYRDTLVRDVHHRIKNHLQGVSSLLERHASANASLQAVIEDVLGQMNTLALVHGLQSEAGGREVELCEIVRGIVGSLRQVVTVPLVFSLPQAFVPFELNVEEAVPIALVLNELVANALKHLGPCAESAGIEVELRREGERALVVVRNQPARLPPGFDLSNPATLGIGLRLVRALLPEDGAKLGFRQSAADVVEAALELWPPVIHVAAAERRRFGVR